VPDFSQSLRGFPRWNLLHLPIFPWIARR